MEQNDEPSHLVQRLMSCDEVYLYKIPPMKDSGGHRAEDWDLAHPIKTCSLLVERRADALYLDFTDDGKLFAQSRIEIQPDGKGFNLRHWLEQAVDTSRYFALKIQGAGEKEATIGFGFRDRDQAMDLRESLQHYNKSIEREGHASEVGTKFTIAKLAKGEKMHITLARKPTKAREPISAEKKQSGKGLTLLRKPPPPAN